MTQMRIEIKSRAMIPFPGHKCDSTTVITAVPEPSSSILYSEIS